MPSRVQLIMLAQLEEHRSVGLPTSRAQFFSRAQAVDFLYFLRQQRPRALDQLPEREMRSEGLRKSLTGLLSGRPQAQTSSVQTTIRGLKDTVMLNFLERRPYTTTT